MLCCIVLYCIVLYCIVLYCIVVCSIFLIVFLGFEFPGILTLLDLSVLDSGSYLIMLAYIDSTYDMSTIEPTTRCSSLAQRTADFPDVL